MAKTTTMFDATSTTDEVLEGVDLSGQRVLITGISAGLGLETARVLLEHGAEVVGTARDLHKAREATASLGDHRDKLRLVELDLASLNSVRRCSDELVAEGKPFDVVIANAGVMACPYGTTEDGFETQFGTNHLGHFLLINRIVPLIKSGGRVVVLASLAHHFADVDLEDPNFETTPYVEFHAYGRSKTANVLFALEFDRRHRSRGIRAVAVHPGGIATELTRHLTPEVLEQLPRPTASESSDESDKPSSRQKTIPQGAATTVWCGFVASAEDIGGSYCEDCHRAEVNDAPAARQGVRSYALDPERAKQLWARSEAMVGEVF